METKIVIQDKEIQNTLNEINQKMQEISSLAWKLAGYANKGLKIELSSEIEPSLPVHDPLNTL